MIDRVEFTAKKMILKDCDFEIFKAQNCLELYDIRDCKFDNRSVKDLLGYEIKVQKLGNDLCKISFLTSLHKLWNKRISGLNEYSNHNLFTFENVKQTIHFASNEIGIDLTKLNVTYYEIGVNLHLKCSVSMYLNIIRSIEYKNSKEKKSFYIERSVASKTMKGNLKDDKNRIDFVIYDKVQEMRDKNFAKIPLGNIARLEKKVSRCEKITVGNFIDSFFVNRLVTNFAKDCKSIEFDKFIGIKDVTAQKKQLLNEIYVRGNNDKVISEILEEMREKAAVLGAYTKDQLRRNREFLQRKEYEPYLKNLKISDLEVDFFVILDNTINKAKYITY
jgi:hypothetical protein